MNFNGGHLKHRPFILVLVLVALCGCFPAHGQDYDTSTIAAKLTSFAADHPVEKAYLQFDKPYYAAGDTIYFKAYVTAGEVHRLSGLSGVLHVDLINTKDKIDQSIKLQLDSSIAWGDFALPDSLPGGNYRIRAYTQWMRNNGEIDFFDKVIPVGSSKTLNTPVNIAKQPIATALKPDVQFFPEGGSLVAGLRSKIAFKAVGANGMGIGIKGSIIDNENKPVTTFASSHLGMGCFYLEPEPGKTYTAKIGYPTGQVDRFSLPLPAANGVVLSVDNDLIPQASVNIATSKTYFNDNRNKAYTLLIYSGGLITTVNCKLESPTIKLELLKRKLHTGVATITLFSPEDEPLCERLIFIENYDRLNLNVNADKEIYAKREKVSLNLSALNRKDDPVEGHFSVSVINEDKVPGMADGSDNILSYFLLTSDLKGYVEQPNYYFADTSAAARSNLDLLTLTQGYRHFEWKQILDTTKQERVYLPEKGIELSGQVTNPFGKPVGKGTITLIPSKGGQLLSSKTDDEGIFHFPNLIFTDTAHFVLSAVNTKNKNNTKIAYFDGARYAPVVQKSFANISVQVPDNVMSSYLANDKQQREDANFKTKGILLKQVNIHEKKTEDNQYLTESLAGAGHADQVMHADEIAQVQGPIATSLNGRLRGVVFVGSNLFKVPVLAPNGVHPMLVVIDGAEVDAGDINFLTPNDIETIEVLKYAGTAMYGMAGGNGVLVITTKLSRGLSAKDISSVGVLPISPMGFYKAREFYSPKYDRPGNNIKQADLRSTIYWQPELKTDSHGHASFDFYNADGTGTYKMVIEGIDKDGNIGRLAYRYKVE